MQHTTAQRPKQPGPGASDAYKVVWIPTSEIRPSPENDELYGEVQHDDSMERLIDSIERRGLDQPLTVTVDRWLLSGHRRYYALDYLGWKHIPCRVSQIKRAGNPDFHRALVDFNPQRVKSVGSILKEALLQNENLLSTAGALEKYKAASLKTTAQYTKVPGHKHIKPISERRMEFLEAAQKVIEELRPYWPLSVRQVHYHLLNAPPLKMAPKRSKFPPEHYRYKNDDASYDALSRLLTDARYLGHIDFDSLDDATRPRVIPEGWECVDDFVNAQVEGFLTGYHRDRQQGQPRHLEILGEKNTLMAILRPIAEEYYIPLTVGRGFAGPSIWRDMGQRFEESGRESMVLFIISDFDPSGLELADDAIRTLRDLWRIPISYHRVGVSREQVDELNLSSDFCPAKVSSSLYANFVERTGGEQCWEVEALPPRYVAEQLKAAIEANLDMKLFSAILDQEKVDCEQLRRIREELADSMEL